MTQKHGETSGSSNKSSIRTTASDPHGTIDSVTGEDWERIVEVLVAGTGAAALASAITAAEEDLGVLVVESTGVRGRRRLGFRRRAMDTQQPADGHGGHYGQYGKSPDLCRRAERHTGKRRQPTAINWTGD